MLTLKVVTKFMVVSVVCLILVNTAIIALRVKRVVVVPAGIMHIVYNE